MNIVKKLDKVVTDKTTTIEEAFKKFDKINDIIKYKAFGRVTINKERKEKHEKDQQEK